LGWQGADCAVLIVSSRIRRRIFRQLGLISAALCLTGCAFNTNPLAEHREFLREHVNNNPGIDANHLHNAGFSLHYKTRGNAEKGILLWIHGTPGSWSDIGKLFVNDNFLSQVKLVSIDRPGWGESQYEAMPRLVTDFDEISNLLKPLLQHLRTQYPKVPIIVGGHSWGGSVVPAVAMNNTELVSGILTTAAGLDPELAGPRWYNRLANNGIVSRIIGDDLHAANQEIYALPEQLRLQARRLPGLSLPVIVIHGMSDSLVDPRNSDFAERLIGSEKLKVVRLPKQGHLLQIEQTDLIASCVFAVISNRLSACAR